MELQGPQEALLLRLMDAAGKRSRVLANNLANQNTPGYRRQVVRFEELLGAAIQRGETDLGGIEAAVVSDFDTKSRTDGNNVIPELEKSASQENRVLAESYLTLIEGHYRMLRDAIGLQR
jgi:flagellar basal-body rod protein FlgB